MSGDADKLEDVPGRVAVPALVERLRSVIDRALDAARFFRVLVAISAGFCLVGSAALAAYLDIAGGDVGGVMKIALGGIVAAGFLTLLLLAVVWLALGRVASIEADLDGLGQDVAALLQSELAESQPAPAAGRGTLAGRFQALRLLARLAVKIRALGGSGQQLASTLSKAALLGNPLANLGVLALALLGFAWPLCGAALLALRFCWRARGGG